VEFVAALIEPEANIAFDHDAPASSSNTGTP
jgi:hypothetical protein